MRKLKILAISTLLASNIMLINNIKSNAQTAAENNVIKKTMKIESIEESIQKMKSETLLERYAQDSKLENESNLDNLKFLVISNTRMEAVSSEEDFDGDGLTDQFEYEVLKSDLEDINSPGTGFVAKKAGIDSDSDGLTDEFELSLGLNPNNIDSDDDGFLEVDGENTITATDSLELLVGSNPLKKDSDGDGVIDSAENFFDKKIRNTNSAINSRQVPFESNFVATRDFEDLDKDGLSDEFEEFIKTNKELKDTDNDFLFDSEELFYATNPSDIDTDKDGIIDAAEIFILGNYYKLDSDETPSNPAINAKIPGTNFIGTNSTYTESSIITDQYEQYLGTLNIDPYTDNDNDLLENIEEIMFGFDINNIDTNNDGITDYANRLITNSDPIANGQYNTAQGLQITNFVGKTTPKDSDKDYLTDEYELSIGANPNNIDTDNDGLVDMYDQFISRFDLNLKNLGNFQKFENGATNPLNPGTGFKAQKENQLMNNTGYTEEFYDHLLNWYSNQKDLVEYLNALEDIFQTTFSDTDYFKLYWVSQVDTNENGLTNSFEVHYQNTDYSIESLTNEENLLSLQRVKFENIDFKNIDTTKLNGKSNRITIDSVIEFLFELEGTTEELKLQFDNDYDGLVGYFEAEYGLNPNNPDTNQDGVIDGIQLYNSLVENYVTNNQVDSQVENENTTAAAAVNSNFEETGLKHEYYLFVGVILFLASYRLTRKFKNNIF